MSRAGQQMQMGVAAGGCRALCVSQSASPLTFCVTNPVLLNLGRERLVEYQWDQVCIYHLLCAAFSQCVAITKVVDLNIFDEVTILLIYFVVQSCAFVSRGGRGFRCACSCVGRL